MRRQLVLVSALALGAYAGAQPPWVQAPGRTPGFQGYWMGVDPVDGGDSRRSLIRQDDGRYALAARDSLFSLCDGTDRAFASFTDGTVTGNVLESNSLTIACLDGPSVELHVRYELRAAGLMREITTRPDGSPISTIVFHKVSLD